MTPSGIGPALPTVAPNKKLRKFTFHSRDIIKVLLPTDAQENCFKRSITIDIKTAPTCFGVITIIRERTI
jgi:hypothetical protein